MTILGAQLFEALTHLGAQVCEPLTHLGTQVGAQIFPPLTGLRTQIFDPLTGVGPQIVDVAPELPVVVPEVTDVALDVAEQPDHQRRQCDEAADHRPVHVHHRESTRALPGRSAGSAAARGTMARRVACMSSIRFPVCACAARVSVRKSSIP